MARPVRETPIQRIATVLAVLAALVVVTVIALIVAFLIATRDRDGDELAAENVGNAAHALADDLARIREPIDAETVAAERFESASAAVEPLSWSGTGGPGETMTIDARISDTVDENSIGGFYGPFNSAGSASRCYRYTVVALQDATYEEISCEGLPTPAESPASHRPSLPDDAAERVERILTTTRGSELAEALRLDFPGSEFTVDAVETPDGELVAAVGVQPGTDCVLRVRLRSGEIIAPSYDQIWLEPGETGCSTELYTAPPS